MTGNLEGGKKRNPHTQSQQLCLAVSQEDVPRLPSAPKARRATCGLPHWAGLSLRRNFFPWVAANEAPEFIKNPKPRAWLVVLTARPWVSPSRRGCLPRPPSGYPTDPRSAEPEGRRRCRGRVKGSIPPAQRGEGTNAPGAAGASAGAAVGSPWAGSPWAGMRSRKDRFGRE